MKELEIGNNAPARNVKYLNSGEDGVKPVAEKGNSKTTTTTIQWQRFRLYYMLPALMIWSFSECLRT